MMKSVRISSRVVIVEGRGGGWSPKATRREPTGFWVRLGYVCGGGVQLVLVGDLRSSELKTWPFWRTRARGSAIVVV